MSARRAKKSRKGSRPAPPLRPPGSGGGWAPSLLRPFLLPLAREAAARAESAGLKEDAERIREAISRYERREPMRSPAR